MDVPLLQLAAALAQGTDVPGPDHRDDLLANEKLFAGFADLLATGCCRRTPRPAGLRPPAPWAGPAASTSRPRRRPTADGRRRGTVRESRDVDPRAELVAGLRMLRDHVEQLEVETASVMRRSGTTARQLAYATGLSERQANNRYRRVRSGGYRSPCHFGRVPARSSAGFLRRGGLAPPGLPYLLDAAPGTPSRRERSRRVHHHGREVTAVHHQCHCPQFPGQGAASEADD